MSNTEPSDYIGQHRPEDRVIDGDRIICATPGRGEELRANLEADAMRRAMLDRPAIATRVGRYISKLTHLS